MMSAGPPVSLASTHVFVSASHNDRLSSNMAGTVLGAAACGSCSICSGIRATVSMQGGQGPSQGSVGVEVSSSVQSAQEQPATAQKPLEPQQPPAKKVATLQPDSYHPYSIMLSSCRLPQSARKVVSDYKKAGLAPYVVKVKFESGEEWLRVLTGHYQTRREAVQAKKEHQLKSAIVKRTPYANLIGTYASPDEMQADLQQVKKLGYSPYFLQTPAGQFKLLVGAFVTEKGAQNLQAELQAKGIQNTVVIR